MVFKSFYKSSPLMEKLVSKDNLLCGWKRVSDNHGCAGSDGISINEFRKYLNQNLAVLAEEISHNKYRPLPLLKVLVDKGKDNGENRILSIPAVKDRVAQSSMLNTIEPLFEAEFEDCSFAYRKGYSWRQAVQKVRDYYNQGYRWVLDADIDAFFDSVPHERLLEKINRIIPDDFINHLISLWVKAEVWDGAEIVKLAKGIPQGSVISPLLANLYLDEFDEQLLGQGMRLVRYADDFIILCKTYERARDATQLTEEVLKRMELCLDESDIINFDKGFKFLGVIFLHSDAFIPFGKEKKLKKVKYMPPPLNLEDYYAGLYPRQSTCEQ